MSSRRIFSMTEGERKIELFGKESGDLEIHMDGVWGFTYVGGACKINLYTVVPSSEDNYERREVVARITMLPPMLFAMKEYLDQQCKRLKERGVVLSPEGLSEELIEKIAKEMAENISAPAAAEALPAPKQPKK